MISDLVLVKDLPGVIKESVEAYVAAWLERFLKKITWLTLKKQDSSI